MAVTLLLEANQERIWTPAEKKMVWLIQLKNEKWIHLTQYIYSKVSQNILQMFIYFRHKMYTLWESVASKLLKEFTTS